jgi:hypothetical protein
MRLGKVDYNTPITYGPDELTTAYEVEQDMETFLNVNLLTSAEHTMLYQFGAALATELRKLKQYGPTQPTIY